MRSEETLSSKQTFIATNYDHTILSLSALRDHGEKGFREAVEFTVELHKIQKFKAKLCPKTPSHTTQRRSIKLHERARSVQKDGLWNFE
jgi:hypothetical protein